MGSAGFGVLMGAVGVGAVVAALFLPNLKRRWSIDRLIVFAASLFASAQLAMSFARGAVAPLLVAFALGVAYALLVSLFNATAQAMFPPKIRARAISIYFICFYGVLAASSSIWGEIAEARSMAHALRISSIVLFVAAACLFRWPSRSEPQ
jgi:predicted MFS family arabinose efflux permease